MKIGNKEFPYSFSQNRLYNDCPRKYKYRYVDGIKEPTNENLELGSAIHKVLEFLYDYNPVDDSQVADAVDTIIALKGSLYYNQLVKELRELPQTHPDYNLGRELQIKRDDFISVIDLAHNYAAQSHKYTLADYKVTKKPKTEDSIFDEGQLLIYKYLWCLEHPQVKPDDVWVQYVNILPYLSAKIVSVTEPYMVSFETCENLFKQVQATKQKILEGEFPKKKNWCRWCYYKDKCDQDCE
jgi:hypothetical protein